MGLQQMMILAKVLNGMLLRAANITSKSAGAKGRSMQMMKITVKDLCPAIKDSYFFSVASLMKRRQNRLPYQRVSKIKSLFR